MWPRRRRLAGRGSRRSGWRRSTRTCSPRRQRQRSNGVPWFSFTKADRRVSVFLLLPVGRRVRAGVHQDLRLLPLSGEGVGQRARVGQAAGARAGIGFTALSNGFATCEDPAVLQAICDRLGPRAIQVFFERWMSLLPLPLTVHDRDAGYWWELSMRQIEVSRTLVFDAPRRARGFFEALVADNLDLGRPDIVELIFTGQARRPRPPPQGAVVFKTKVVTRDTDVTINAFYKHSRVKQYLKDGRALRIETVINAPGDLRCQRRLHNLADLQAKARDVNDPAAATLSGSARAVSLRAQPLSGSRMPPSRPRAGGLQPCVSATLGSWPWPAPRRHALSAHRHHQQEPARPDDRPARRPLHWTNQMSYDLARLRPTASSNASSTPTPTSSTPDGQRVRGLLHQAPRPAPAPAARRRPSPAPPAAHVPP